VGTELEPFHNLAPRVSRPLRPLIPGSVSRRMGELLGDWEPDADALDAQTRATYEATEDPDERLYMRLHLAVWQDAPGFLEASGLTGAEPPDNVHAMARGPLAAGGSFSAADMIAEAMSPDTKCALDFGGSSGRVVRVLAAMRPEIAWEACDPNASAIEWAAENIRGVRFSVCRQDPPLDVEDGKYDLVYAISVWSHFGEEAARAWLREMHRIVKPGGLLVLTTQGYETLGSLARSRGWRPRDINQALADLCLTGHHFHDVFARDGDHGIRHGQWGWAFTSGEWMLDEVTPRWIVKRFAPARHENNQDLWVLKRA
jgi:SAM-dependent methyltransferase